MTKLQYINTRKNPAVNYRTDTHNNMDKYVKIIPSKRSQTQTPFIWNSRKDKSNYSDQKEISTFPAQEPGRDRMTEMEHKGDFGYCGNVLLILTVVMDFTDAQICQSSAKSILKMGTFYCM